MFATSRPTLCSRPASRRERAGGASRLSRGCESASDRTVHGVINNVVPVSSVSLSVPRRGALFSAALAPLALFATPPASAAPKKRRAAPGDTDQREAAARDEKAAARAPEVSFAIGEHRKREQHEGLTRRLLARHGRDRDTAAAFDKIGEGKTGRPGRRHHPPQGGAARRHAALTRRWLAEPLKKKHPALLVISTSSASSRSRRARADDRVRRQGHVVGQMDPSAVTPDVKQSTATRSTGDGPQEDAEGLPLDACHQGLRHPARSWRCPAHTRTKCATRTPRGTKAAGPGRPAFNNSYFVLRTAWRPRTQVRSAQFQLGGIRWG